MIRTATALILLAAPALADPAEITNVNVTRAGDAWRFDVTVAHPDTGWDHYADGWEVRAPDGTVLGTRPLAHPHVNEQPFTRSLSGVVIPDTVAQVHVFVRDNLSGWGEEPVIVDLP